MVGKKILITGGHGFLGKHLVKALGKDNNVLAPESIDYDLTIADHAEALLSDAGPVDYLFHLAADVGGIGYNLSSPYRLFYNNAIMGINLIDEAMFHDVGKFVQIGTACSYPADCPAPSLETDFWCGEPEEANAPYGMAKKMLLVQLQAARKSYNFKFAYIILANLYGPGDCFDDDKSHVIPALIKKITAAKMENRPSVDVWGSGRPTRDFLYVTDAVRGIIAAAEKYDDPEPINLGSGQAIVISSLVNMISSLVDYRGEINWIKDKPDGQKWRLLNTRKAEHWFNWRPEMDIMNGLKKTIEWYEENICQKLAY